MKRIISLIVVTALFAACEPLATPVTDPPAEAVPSNKLGEGKLGEMTLGNST